MHTIELSEAGDIADWAERWDALARESGGLYFRSASWAASWWRIIEPDSSMTLLVDGRTDRPTGLFPLSALHRQVHPRVPVRLPFIGIAGSGFGAADGLGPITADPESGRRLLGAAVQAAGRTPLVLDNVAPEHRAACSALRGATAVSTVRRPGLDLDRAAGGTTAWSPKLRKSLRRRERRLADEGFRRRWIRLTIDTADELRELERLHNRLWATRGGSGLFGPRRMAFFRDLAAYGGSEEGPWLQLIERDGTAIAALFGFRFGRTFCSYKTGWDPDHHSLGLGIALHSAAIEWAAEHGLARYDFLRGANPHKYTLGGVDVVDTTFVLPNGWRGRPLLMRERLAARRSATPTD